MKRHDKVMGTPLDHDEARRTNFGGRIKFTTKIFGKDTSGIFGKMEQIAAALLKRRKEKGWAVLAVLTGIGIA